MPRSRIVVRGIVQGVGFRPFVHGLAARHGIAGFVLNDGVGVLIEAEGSDDALGRFVTAVTDDAPGLARVDSVETEPLAERGERGFRIEASRASQGTSPIPADTATCDACLSELFDPSDRRYRYPFINCTQCGPRFTIVTSAPYDRARTTMAAFALCDACRREYEDPADRRFHAEPIACPVCGPALSLPIEQAAGLLRNGAILAVKGLGGYHLACDAGNEDAVARLRARKHRDDKPFALMARETGALAEPTEEEQSLLSSRARPIVILRRHPQAPIAPSVAPGTPWIGLMLAYTPLHHLLLELFGGPLVMTSGNRSDEPIAFEDDEALIRLAGIADAFLTHDRPIHRRCEDSVVRAEFPIRRSRGYAPQALPLAIAAPQPLLAVGAQLKHTFCIASETQAFLSPHLGDLDSELAYRAFLTDLELYSAMLGARAAVIAHDLHPEYLSTKWALEQDTVHVGVQHHHAHAAACLAEHGEGGPALALVFDGTGYGPDGTLWGGELLHCGLRGFERVAHLDAIPLPGGEAAIREPWRVAAGCLERTGLPVPWERWGLVRNALGVHAPLSSGMGRVFDAVAAVLGVRDTVSYEGQAAIELEQLAGQTDGEPWPWRFGASDELVARCAEELGRGRDRGMISADFHETVAEAAAVACLEAAGPELVVLSGGTFQNVRLLASITWRLERYGFRVLSHRRVPPNDAGISFGQAAVAVARARAE